MMDQPQGSMLQGWALDDLNNADAATWAALMRRCCASERWASSMDKARPFSSWPQLFHLAEEAWWQLGPADWRQAFEHHPPIGASSTTINRHYAETAVQSQKEQSGMARATPEEQAAFTELNARYQERFGYVFLICASGRSAGEMLAALQRRLHQAPEAELREASGELAKIMLLRLHHLQATRQP